MRNLKFKQRLYLLTIRIKFGKSSREYFNDELFIRTFDEIPLSKRGRFFK